MKKQFSLWILAGIILLVAVACKKNDTVTSSTDITTGGGTSTLPAVFGKFSSAVTISVSGDYVVLTTKDLPNHKSCYWSATDSLYQAYNGTNTNFAINPNRIIQQNMTFKIPLNPTAASTHAATPLGPIGISLNGVPFFNQYAGPNQPLAGEINSFDQYLGHPQMSGMYHYHIEPTYLTQTKGSSSILGFLLDGFPVYGPVENGRTVVNDSLDVYHGHVSATADYPNGIYHYHVTATAPYINGSGFWGTAGTVTQ